MAVGCRTRMHTDLAVSTVGVAGPGDLGPDKPAGTVFVGLAWDGGSSSSGFSWTGLRTEVQRRTAKLALNRVRLHLLSPRLSRVRGNLLASPSPVQRAPKKADHRPAAQHASSKPAPATAANGVVIPHCRKRTSTVSKL